jgi:hypothetical protein
MSSKIVSRNTNPVEVPYTSLPPGSSYTVRCDPCEPAKVKGQESREVEAEATRRGTVIVWLTDDEWEQHRAALTVPYLGPEPSPEPPAPPAPPFRVPGATPIEVAA